MSIDEAIDFAEANNYEKEVIERLKDYRALLMFLAKGKPYSTVERVDKYG